MLLGENPFRGESLAETFNNIQKKKISAKAFDTSIPKEIVNFLLGLLRKDPRKRPMANDIAEFFSKMMHRYPRDLRPYIVEWANAALNGTESSIEPVPYRDKKKLSFKAGLIVGAIVTLAISIAVHYI